MNLSKIKLHKLTKKASQVNTRLDYLRLLVNEPIAYFEYIIDALPSDNSIDYHDEHFSYKKTKSGNGYILTVLRVYDTIAVPVMFYQLNESGLAHKLKYHARLDLYGAIFRFFEIGDLPENLFETYFGQDLGSAKISRVDYCQDFFYKQNKSFPDAHDLFDDINKASQVHRHGLGADGVNSWSIGSKSSSRYMIRLYDKKIDLSAKGKFRYYGDYFHWADVHRLEYQFASHFCRGYTFASLHRLVGKISSLLDTKNYDGLVFYHYDPSIDYIPEDQKIRYFRIFATKVKRLVASGYNPFSIALSVLQEENNSALTHDEKIQIQSKYMKLLATAINSLDHGKQSMLQYYIDMTKSLPGVNPLDPEPQTPSPEENKRKQNKTKEKKQKQTITTEA